MIHDIYLFYGYNNGYDIYYLKIYFEMKYIEDIFKFNISL